MTEVWDKPRVIPQPCSSWFGKAVPLLPVSAGEASSHQFAGRVSFSSPIAPGKTSGKMKKDTKLLVYHQIGPDPRNDKSPKWTSGSEE